VLKNGRARDLLLFYDHVPPIYGSIPSIRVSHDAPPDCKVVSTDEHSRRGSFATLVHTFSFLCTVVKIDRQLIPVLANS
jgi:hypothetical protein